MLLVALTAMVQIGCSDDDSSKQSSSVYGYVQFKLYKSASAEGQKAGSRAFVLDQLERLSDACKIKVVLRGSSATTTQVLALNAFDSENAEYGLRSDKVKLVAGAYKLIGYTLYDKVDRELITIDVTSDFEVVAGGLWVEDLSVPTEPRGKASFRVVKNITGASRAVGEDGAFPLNSVASVDITVQNTQTYEQTTYKAIKTKYIEDFHDNGTPGKNPQTSYLRCDSIIWMPAGEYKVLSFKAYSDKKGTKVLNEVLNLTDKTFTVKDNELSKDVEVPFDIKASWADAPIYIKDYIALKKIWDAMGGPEWRYKGIVEPDGCNWNFNKDIDLWGEQPGVQLHADGRVATISLEGFGAKGNLPSAIGQLTELMVLYLSSHSEELGSHYQKFNPADDEQNENLLKAVRKDYEDRFLVKDFRSALSEEWQKTIELDTLATPILKRISTKGIQFGDFTNGITGVSKAIMRCTKLEQFYIANAPIKSETFFVDDIDENHEYAAEENTWSWANFTSLTDIEIYNCKNMTSLPMDMIANLPELQMLNIACMKGISGAQLKADWEELIDNPTTNGGKIQGIYMGYNNLEEFPVYEKLCKMEKLGLLDLTNNKIHTLHPFGKGVNIAKLYLDYNKIKSVPHAPDGFFCGFTQMEGFSISNNEIEEFPDIFDAKLIHICPSIDFSGNKISRFENGDAFKGVNANQVNLSKNELKTFPSILFKTGSPLTYLVLSGNGMTEIPKGSLEGKYSYMLEAIDLSYNKLSDLPEDFNVLTLPLLTGIDISYNCFEKFPWEPLTIQGLARYFIRYQADKNGNRCLSEWPTGIWQHLGLRFFLMGGNDLRKIEDTMPTQLFYLEVADNPNITMNVSELCPYISYGYIMFIYDKTQDIRGCDILDIEN